MSWSYDQLNDKQKRMVDMAGHPAPTAFSPAGTQPIKRRGIPNELEKKFYVDFLAPRELTGDLTDVHYETEAFPIAHRCTYTPDYLARDKNGALVAFECKANHRFREKGIFKAKFFATSYPNIQLFLAEFKKGQWVLKHIPPMAKRDPLIPELPQDDE